MALRRQARTGFSVVISLGGGAASLAWRPPGANSAWFTHHQAWLLNHSPGGGAASGSGSGGGDTRHGATVRPRRASPTRN